MQYYKLSLQLCFGQADLEQNYNLVCDTFILLVFTFFTLYFPRYPQHSKFKSLKYFFFLARDPYHLSLQILSDSPALHSFTAKLAWLMFFILGSFYGIG